MTVYVFDNGRQWSDHQIWFVEPTDDEASYFAEFVEMYGRAWPSDSRNEHGERPMHLLAKISSADWFAKRASVTDFLEKLSESSHFDERVRGLEAARRCVFLAGLLVPNLFEFYGEPEFEECSDAQDKRETKPVTLTINYSTSGEEVESLLRDHSAEGSIPRDSTIATSKISANTCGTSTTGT